MHSLRTSQRAAVLGVLGLGATLWTGCSDRSPTGPSSFSVPDIRAALTAQRRNTDALMRVPGVVGTAVGLLPSGEVAVKVLVADPGVRGLPTLLDGGPVATQVTGMLVAFSTPTLRARPAP